MAARRYQAANGDHIRKRKKEYRHNNPELTELRRKKHYEERKTKIAQYHNRYREMYRDEIKRKQKNERKK